MPSRALVSLVLLSFAIVSLAGADGDSLVVFPGKDLAAAPRVTLRISGGRATSRAANSIVLTNPLGSMDGMATSAFGSYTATYEQAGRELRISRRTTGATTIQPPSERKALIAWMREIAKDDAKLIVIETGGSSSR